jgi:hypothetical protein
MCKRTAQQLYNHYQDIKLDMTSIAETLCMSPQNYYPFLHMHGFVSELFLLDYVNPVTSYTVYPIMKFPLFALPHYCPDSSWSSTLLYNC